MKSIYCKTIATVLAALCILSSCKTTEKFTVHGKPGTELYSPSVTAVGVIPESGKLTVKLPSSDYYPFMLAKEPASNYMVPFGLDVRKKSCGGEKFANVLGMSLAVAGLTAMIPGVALVAQEDAADDAVDVGAAMCLVGGVLVGVGSGIGAPASERLKQTTHKYQFTYLPDQHTISADILKPLSSPDAPKSAATPKNKVRRGKASSGSGATTTLPAQSGIKAKKSFGDHAGKIAAEYACSGNLTLNGRVVETYPEVIVTLSKLDKNKVNVNVVIDGEDFFDAAYTYRVARQTNGSYILTMEGLDSARITISPSGALTYTNLAVNIDGDLYTLTATSR